VNHKLLRLGLAAVLFAAWMGYLGYLVYALPVPTNNPLVDSLRPPTTHLAPVVSRPQFLVSTLDVIGTVDVEAGTVKVEEVLYPADAEGPKKGDEIKVANLKDADPPLPDSGTVGPCLLLLQASEDGSVYRVAPVPPSPGYGRGKVFIYSADAERLAEYRRLEKPRPPEHPPAP
jgi:hypothetical protein